MKFANFTCHSFLVAAIVLATVSCKKDVSFDNPTGNDDVVRKPIRLYYSDSATGFCDAYQTRDSAFEPGAWNYFYNLSATGSGTKMAYAKVLSSFQILTGRGSNSGHGVSLNATFQKELKWDDLDGIPNEVCHLIYDYNGNAIWFKMDKLIMQKKTADMILFTGNSIVVGGTGLYARATGDLEIEVKINLHETGKNIITQKGFIILQ
jgi:hypothetical protein